MNPKEPRYLGDGWWIKYDSGIDYYILSCRTGQEIFLEPGAANEFVKFVNETKTHYENISKDNPAK